MADEKKSPVMLAALFGKLKPKGGEPGDDGEEAVGGGEDMNLRSEGLHSAMKDLLIAIHKSDPEAMAEAFQDAVELACDDDDEGEDKNEEGDEDGEEPKLDYRR